MLKLRYNLKRDEFQFVTVFGDPAAIRNLYWQLTHNYAAQDGAAIGDILVSDMDGIDRTAVVMTNPFSCAAPLTTIE